MEAPENPLPGHIFVLMLENHSFDHLLGFSGLSGKDAETNEDTTVNGLAGTESNTYNGITYTVQQPAGFSMPVDPGHEFIDTLLELTGTTVYEAGNYPSPDNSGFVNDYVNSPTPGEGHAPGDYGEIMKCFSKDQLPVLNALASAFAVCDNWFSSMPGPTWPNRFFVHAASSGGLDHSPTTTEIALWQSLGGMNFKNGTVFDQLHIKYDNPYRLYRGDNFLSDDFPNVAALKGISSIDCHPVNQFSADIAGDYPWPYTFIEPSYGDVLNNTYKGGTSQHPLDDATGGERLIKQVYETIRNSPLWEDSLLLILWDEHGGFYDHVPPPKAIPPGDPEVSSGMNQYGFDFSRYGVRVPAVIVSPLIPAQTIDHRLYDHASVSRTLQDLLGLSPMTDRDRSANSLLPLLIMLDAPRTDCPATLPEPADSGLTAEAPEVADISIPANHGSLPGFLHAALKTDLQLSPESEYPAIEAQFASIQTQKDARNYMAGVQAKVAAGSNN